MCITSSPNFPQANGKVELAVQTVKNFIKKESDPYKALKAGRGTSLVASILLKLLMGKIVPCS